MADHDRDDGSRGETPRDPINEEGAAQAPQAAFDDTQTSPDPAHDVFPTGTDRPTPGGDPAGEPTVISHAASGGAASGSPQGDAAPGGPTASGTTPGGVAASGATQGDAAPGNSTASGSTQGGGVSGGPTVSGHAMGGSTAAGHGAGGFPPGGHAAGGPGGPVPGGSTGPGWAGPRPPEAGSWRDFARQKPAQIIGAGLIGLILGCLIGGTAVLLIGGITSRASYGDWQRPGMERHHGRLQPDYRAPRYPDCRPVPGGIYCRQPAPYPMPFPSDGSSISPPRPAPTLPSPVPTLPSPLPTRTG
jgi:hypothetical protein